MSLADDLAKVEAEGIGVKLATMQTVGIAVELARMETDRARLALEASNSVLVLPLPSPFLATNDLHIPSLGKTSETRKLATRRR